MANFREVRQRLVSKHGAAAGSVLAGASPNNQGLRLRVRQTQGRGDGGPLRGGFVILDAGDNRHSDALLPLLGRETTAEELLRLLRRWHPACVSVANANLLTVEPG